MSCFSPQILTFLESLEDVTVMDLQSCKAMNDRLEETVTLACHQLHPTERHSPWLHHQLQPIERHGPWLHYQLQPRARHGPLQSHQLQPRARCDPQLHHQLQPRERCGSLLQHQASTCGHLDTLPGCALHGLETTLPFPPLFTETGIFL